MAKFRKKPVIIEAEQWFPGKHIEGVKPQTEYNIPCFDEFDEPERHYWGIHTLEGVMEVKPGDWVITGVQGEKYPCKPEIFKLTYEAV
jgi:hypothetical protein